MSVYAKLCAVVNRIANATGVLRTRTIEQTRVEVNGGTSTELQARHRTVTDRLEQVAEKLENTLA